MGDCSSPMDKKKERKRKKKGKKKRKKKKKGKHWAGIKGPWQDT